MGSTMIIRYCLADHITSTGLEVKPLSIIRQLGKFFSIKGQSVNISSFVGHMLPTATTQICHCRMKSVIDNT